MIELPSSDPALRRAYLLWNRMYFGGELPEDTVLWFEPLPVHAEMGDGDERRGRQHGLTKGAKDEFYIVIDPSARWSKSLWGMDLLHEMAHVCTYPYVGHGKRFQDEMKRLAVSGAFKNLW